MMEVNTILIAVFAVTVLGILLAATLCILAKLMYVKVDERLAQLNEIMPGANCGACGFPGCGGFAKALLSGDAKPNECPPGGAELIVKISAILGVESDAGSGPKIAVISCNGDFNTRQKKMDYFGLQSCEAAKNYYGGDNACVYGCLGYGDCQLVCPSNAICIEGGLARIITDLCTGCTLCVAACPKKIISMEKASNPVFVACKNTEKGGVVKKKCTSGCIGCTKCVKECPSEAISVVNFLAVIDYDKCTGCKTDGSTSQERRCVEVCVSKCILPSPLHKVV
jgi:Na+-translocating ferredoxin:NAD+ oxidoreductase RNF subunit RnfB